MEKVFVKSRRITKACDQCSKYKRKCDGKNPCFVCVERERICSYSKIAKKRGPEPKTKKVGCSNLHGMPLEIPLCLDSLIASHPSNIPHFAPNAIQYIPNSITNNPVANWSREDFLNTRIIDLEGNSNSILDMYFNFPYQHIPMFSKIWIQQNIQDVPIHVLHVMYMLVLVNAKQALPSGRFVARPHTAFVKKAVNDGIEESDPFMIATLINLAMFEFYMEEPTNSIFYISMAVKLAQVLGLDRDIDLKWPSPASGRIMGNEIGMDKQFLRSLWFLLYQWNHHNIFVYQHPMMIDALIPISVVNSYISPNVGDPSNIPIK